MLWRRKIEKKTATKWWCWWNRQKIVQQESCKTTIRDLVKKIENVCRMHFRLWQFQVNIKPTRKKQNQKKKKERIYSATKKKTTTTKNNKEEETRTEKLRCQTKQKFIFVTIECLMVWGGKGKTVLQATKRHFHLFFLFFFSVCAGAHNMQKLTI